MHRKFRGFWPFLRYKIHSRAPEPVGEHFLRVQTWWGPVVVHKASKSITKNLLEYGVYDLDTSLAILHAVRPGMTVVNIGANVGIYALLAAKKVGRKGKVYAFEPDPRSFETLLLNASQYPEIIETLPFAVGDAKKEISLWLDAHEPGDSSMNSKNTHNAQEHFVPMVTIDSFLQEKGAHADVVIMDIQGAELLAFAGMKETLRKNAPMTIFFECSPQYSKNMNLSVDTIRTLLRSEGFTLRHIRRNDLPDPETQWEALVDFCLKSKEGYGFCNLVATK